MSLAILGFYKTSGILNIYCQALSRKINITLPIHIVSLLHIREVLLSMAMTSFPIKNRLIISCTIGRLVRGEKTRLGVAK